MDERTVIGKIDQAEEKAYEMGVIGIALYNEILKTQDRLEDEHGKGFLQQALDLADLVNRYGEQIEELLKDTVKAIREQN